MMKKFNVISRAELLYRAAERAKRLESAIVNLNSDLEKIGGVPGLDLSVVKAVRKDIEKAILKNPL